MLFGLLAISLFISLLIASGGCSITRPEESPILVTPWPTYLPNAAILSFTPIRQTPTMPADRPTSTPVIHVVQAGEVLGEIANRYGVSVDALARVNNLPDADYLRIGQKLVIPNAEMLEAMGTEGAVFLIPGQLTPEATPTPGPGCITWDTAGAYIGREACIEGRIMRTREGGGNIVLYFHTDPFAPYLRALIPEEHRGAFSGHPAIDYLDRYVRLRGILTEVDGTPQITIERPEQVEIIN